MDFTAAMAVFNERASDVLGVWLEIGRRYVGPVNEFLAAKNNLRKHLTLVVSCIALLLDNMLFMAIVPIATELVKGEAGDEQDSSTKNSKYAALFASKVSFVVAADLRKELP